MARSTKDLPAWRLFGATLAAFAIGIQILLSGFLIGHAAVAADRSELSIICGHEGASDPAVPAGPASHDQCPACAFPQAASHFAPPPAAPSVAVVLPRSQPLQVAASQVPGEHSFHSPYASRAPPQSV